jgi:hypothetical protein
MTEINKTTVTIEFPLTDELIDMDKQYLFEMLRQKIADVMHIHSNEVWIKSISAITDYEISNELAAEA